MTSAVFRVFLALGRPPWIFFSNFQNQNPYLSGISPLETKIRKNVKKKKKFEMGTLPP